MTSSCRPERLELHDLAERHRPPAACAPRPGCCAPPRVDLAAGLPAPEARLASPPPAPLWAP